MMKGRNFLLGLVVIAAAAVQPNMLIAQTNFPKRPNILFLFTDDQRFDTIAALGNSEIKTPNMDKLVRSGMTFTHAHIMGSMSGAVCMPSRAMLMTGRTLFHLQGAGNKIPLGHKTLPEVLRKAGYNTFGTGKWHNGTDVYARSFTNGGKIFFGGMSDHLHVPVYDFDPAGRYSKDRRYIAGKFSSNLFSDAAIEFIKNYKDDRPFFAYVSYTAPHDPRMAPKEYADMYPPVKIRLPKNFLPQHPFDNGEMKIRDELLAPFPRTPAVIREHIAGYYWMISHLDAQIGRVLQALEAGRHADNTIIVFSGDNGLAVGQHGLMGKQNLYDHSVRVPLIISGPNLPKGKKCAALCYLLDIFPTLCDLTGVAIPDSVEGKSLVPLLQGSKTQIRDSLFFAYKNVQRAVHTERWKLIWYNVEGKQTTQLFDLKNDPEELNNLADNPKQAERVKLLTARLTEWMKTSGDKCDPDKADWGVRTR
ncbi:MAG: sulfatase-like hydrolase/transferase [Planctomycetota bacterium]